MNSSHAIQIHQIEQDILEENRRYQDASQNKDDEELRIDSLRRILALQKKLQQLKTKLKR